MYTPEQRDFYDTVKKARKLFPNEIIFYDLGGDISITKYVEQLKQRIAEAEELERKKAES